LLAVRRGHDLHTVGNRKILLGKRANNGPIFETHNFAVDNQKVSINQTRGSLIWQRFAFIEGQIFRSGHDRKRAPPVLDMKIRGRLKLSVIPTIGEFCL